MKVRAADDWQAGDMAYCFNNKDVFSRGDIVRVASTSLAADPSHMWLFLGRRDQSSRSFGRVLTPNEVRNLPAGAVVQHIRPSGYYQAGQNLTIQSSNLPYEDGDTNLHLLYALVSLPVDVKRDEALARIEAAEKELAEAKKMLEES